MHRLALGVLAIVFSASTACSSSDSSGARPDAAKGDAGAETSDTGTTPADGGKDTSTSVETGGGDCTGILAEGECATCVEGACCDLLAQCNDTPNCLECITGMAGTGVDCSTVAHVMELGACVSSKCDVCTPKSDCNPVTAVECTTPGSSCDLSSSGVFTCFDPPNDVAMCGACSNDMGPFCAKGMSCNPKDNKCTSYCCDDGDCGAMGKCDKTDIPGGVGRCVTADGSSVCDAPTTAPSGGSCFMK